MSEFGLSGRDLPTYQLEFSVVSEGVSGKGIQNPKGTEAT